MAALGFVGLLRVWSDEPRHLGRNLWALGLVWALLAAPLDLRLWGFSVPVGALVLAAALPLAVRRSEKVERGSVAGFGEADLDDRAKVERFLVHGPEGTWRGNLAVTVELGRSWR